MMCAKSQWLAAVVAAGLISCSGTAAAQSDMFSPSPVSDVSGYASHEMRSIYRGSIGTNYSVSSLTQNDLRRARANVPYVGQSTRFGSGNLGLGLSSGLGSKPFSTVTSRPTVSPYMNLFREDFGGESDLNYQTLVQPQLRQERFNEQVQRQNMDVARRLQAISAQNAYNPRGSQQIYPTGHPTVFMNYGHYYPVSRRRR